MALSIKDFLSDAKLDQASDVFVDGNYAYVVSPTQDTLTILDISDPADISITGQLTDTTYLNGAASVCVVDDYAYIGSYLSFSAYFTIVDVSNKAAPTRVYSSAAVNIVKIINKEDYLFLAKENSSVYVYDIKNRELPILMAYLASLAYPNYVSINNNNILCATRSSTSTLYTVDVKNYVNDFFLGLVSDSKIGGYNYGIASEGNYVYAVDDNYFVVIDISDKENPTIVGSINDATFSGARDVCVDGDYAYVSTLGDVVSVDISDKENPAIDDVLSGSATSRRGIIKDGDYVYQIDEGTKLNVFDVSDPSNISLSDYVACDCSGTYSSGIYKSGDYIYVVDYSKAKLSIIDVSDPADISVVGILVDAPNLNSAYDVIVSGNYAYCACWSDRITVVDISNKAAPAFVSTLQDTTILNFPLKIELEGSDLYVSGVDYISIVDVSNINSMSISSYVYLAVLQNGKLVINGNYLIIGSVSSGQTVKIYDKTKLLYKSGKLLDSLNDSTNYPSPRAVSCDNDYAYIASYNNDCVTLVDISDPADISYYSKVSDATKLDQIQCVYVIGSYIFATSYNQDYFVVIDNTDPSSPTILTQLQDNTNLNGAMRFFISGHYAYVACYLGDGMAVVDVTDWTPVESTFTPKVMLI